jgi:hypothetical protein
MKLNDVNIKETLFPSDRKSFEVARIFQEFHFLKMIRVLYFIFCCTEEKWKKILKDLNIDRFHPLSPRRSFSSN